ncbi:protein-histidine N-methyltransferase [Geosmithia morbida]|uniref:protein-histidine N-methyltransferase n=1 Tax=Geosmithia morbida TaxID=1094350 RepID=A0A9P5D206_9HYPO|nr:protein-histidine N-methyltransferase [Geosmithia morbida]KAF4123332.1 protein-histidine N-methyltransferase [Geosmithia morbida]
MSFSFGFSGEDIDTSLSPEVPAPAVPVAAAAAANSAFPVQGKPQLPPTHHPLPSLLSQLPSKIAYSSLDVKIDGSPSPVRIPRRELWDVRVQLMAEAEGEGVEGLGEHDVKTGVYEGGFKSWESSVDLVKVLAAQDISSTTSPMRVIENQLGCGTALPSLAIFQWAISSRSPANSNPHPLSFVLADYNPSVLQLVTLPNLILCWAVSCRSTTPALSVAFSDDGDDGKDGGELDLDPPVVEAFQTFLAAANIQLSFVSGSWSPEFVQIIYGDDTAGSSGSSGTSTLILGAETIYSPFALRAFTDTVLDMLRRERTANAQASALVGAKRLYFGVGGSLDDFVAAAQEKGADVVQLSEEAEGVRRGVVRCSLPT